MKGKDVEIFKQYFTNTLSRFFNFHLKVLLWAVKIKL